MGNCVVYNEVVLAIEIVLSAGCNGVIVSELVFLAKLCCL